MKEKIVIANCGGFWGDDPDAARRQVTGGPIEYLVMDYLAEVTMALLQKQRRRDPDLGYPRDFVAQLRDVLVDCVEKGITVISNAGGVNPIACRAAVERLAEDLGIRDRVRVAVVVGDDLSDDLDRMLEAGESFTNLDTGRPLAEIRERVLSANAYLGAAPIVRALDLGANIVITGRVTDAGIALAPMIHEFGWSATDWDRLASGLIAGHLLECGPQATGGNFTDWDTVPSFTDIGYPIAEVTPDGSFVITKHPGSGGLVNVHTVSEQLVYETGPPAYLSPDCIARFDSVSLEQEGVDRVRVTGARGGPPPPMLKTSISVAHGYRIFGRFLVSGPDSLAKARLATEIFWEAAGGREAYAETSSQFIGWNACHPSTTDTEPSEIMVQVAARDDDRRKLDQQFGANLVARGLGSIPGFFAPADQGRPRAAEVVAYWPALVSTRSVPAPHVLIGTADEALDWPEAKAEAEAAPTFTASTPELTFPDAGPMLVVPLVRLCLARSGDKGDVSNVGAIARSPAIYAWMLRHLTGEFVAQRFSSLSDGPVERYELPNILGLNFVIHQALGGGGTGSLRLDAQGKTYGQFLLAAPVEVSEALLETIAR